MFQRTLLVSGYVSASLSFLILVKLNVNLPLLLPQQSIVPDLCDEVVMCDVPMRVKAAHELGFSVAGIAFSLFVLVSSRHSS